MKRDFSDPAAALASARMHLARAREVTELDERERLSALARGHDLGEIQSRHVEAAEAAAAVAIGGYLADLVPELARLRVAIEVLAGGSLDGVTGAADPFSPQAATDP